MQNCFNSNNSPTSITAALSQHQTDPTSSSAFEEKALQRGRDATNKTKSKLEAEGEATKDKSASESEDETKRTWTEVVDSFDHMNLSDAVLRGIYSYGFEKPSAIQQRAIMPFIAGNDLIAQAQSGTGKTGTFSIALLEIVDAKLRAPQGIVLAPTRELARQISNVAMAFADFSQVDIHLCVGGRLLRDDIQSVKRAHIVVGTPGRVLDLTRRGAIGTDHLRALVIDEADEMLSRGFRDQIFDIFQALPTDIQVGLFSATLPSDILEITQRFMRKPVKILVKKEMVTLDGIQQYYIDVRRENHKLETLMDLYQTLTISQAIIYCNSRRKVDWLTDMLNQSDFTVSSIHGDMDSSERNLIMKEFRSGSSRVLISTDLLARGIDIHSVSTVINYDIPFVRENYIHRIGRSGRFGRKGIAINFITDHDANQLRDIQNFYNTIIEEMPENVAAITAP
jgi:translation initiation factor 4A